jgi:hypothetical protein
MVILIAPAIWTARLFAGIVTGRSATPVAIMATRVAIVATRVDRRIRLEYGLRCAVPERGLALPAGLGTGPRGAECGKPMPAEGLTANTPRGRAACSLAARLRGLSLMAA